MSGVRLGDEAGVWSARTGDRGSLWELRIDAELAGGRACDPGAAGRLLHGGRLPGLSLTVEAEQSRR